MGNAIWERAVREGISEELMFRQGSEWSERYYKYKSPEMRVYLMSSRESKKVCVGREEIASKAERVPHVERGHPLGVIPKVCVKVTHSWMTQRHKEARPRLGVDSSHLFTPSTWPLFHSFFTPQFLLQPAFQTSAQHRKHCKKNSLNASWTVWCFWEPRGSLMSVKYDTTCTTSNEKFNNEKELFVDYFS